MAPSLRFLLSLVVMSVCLAANVLTGGKWLRAWKVHWKYCQKHLTF